MMGTRKPTPKEIQDLMNTKLNPADIQKPLTGTIDEPKKLNLVEEEQLKQQLLKQQQLNQVEEYCNKYKTKLITILRKEFALLIETHPSSREDLQPYYNMDNDLFTDVLLTKMKDEEDKDSLLFSRTLNQTLENYQSLTTIMVMPEFSPEKLLEADNSKQFDKKFLRRVKHVNSLVEKFNAVCNIYKNELTEIILEETEKNKNRADKSPRLKDAEKKLTFVRVTLQKEILDNAKDFDTIRKKLEHFKTTFNTNKHLFEKATDSATTRFFHAICDLFTGKITTNKALFWQSPERRFRDAIQSQFRPEVSTALKK